MENIKGVLELVSDWYIPEDSPESGYVYPGGMLINSSEALETGARILLRVSGINPDIDFLMNVDGVRFRVHRIKTTPKGDWIQCRKLPNAVPELENLGISPSVYELLIDSKLKKGGLVLIAGETGQGKSTLAASLIKKRLELYGAFCLTLENPIEMPLDGRHGEAGICIQTDVVSGEFATALKGALRSYPAQGSSILLVGETRDPETAGEALMAAANGHLVVTSVHGVDVIGTLKRFISLSATHRMGEQESRQLFSSVFRLAVHQQLIANPSGKKVPLQKFLFSGSNVSSVANRIRSNEIDLLATDYQQQNRLDSTNSVEQLMQWWREGR